MDKHWWILKRIWRREELISSSQSLYNKIKTQKYKETKTHKNQIDQKATNKNK